MRLSPVARLPASSAPPTMHAVLLSPCSMIGGHPPQQIFHLEQHPVLNDTSASDGSSSFRFTNHVSEEARAPPHDTVYETVLAPTSSNTWLRFLLVTFLAHCGRSSSSNLFASYTIALSSMASYGTSVIHLRTFNWSISSVAEQFPHIFCQAFCVQNSSETTSASCLLFEASPKG